MTVENKPLSIGFLGKPKSDHADALGSLASCINAKYIRIPDSPNSGAYQASKIRIVRQLYRGCMQWKGTAHRAYLKDALGAIDSNDVDVLVAYWATNPLADAIAIKRERPRTAVVANVLCHPKGFTGRSMVLADQLFRRAAAKLDGFIFPTHQMKYYFERRIFRGIQVHSTVIPPCWSGTMSPSIDIKCDYSTPSILHMGRTELKTHSRSENLLDQLMNCGINVHYCPADPKAKQHPHQHYFARRSLPELIKFATQFPATLGGFITPSLASSRQVHLSVPDRLISSVASGVPVALPFDGYEAYKEYLHQYEAVIRFDSAEVLANQLRNPDSLRKLKELSQNTRSHYRIEAHAEQYLQFFTTVIDGCR
ncbi:hypothetical protein SH528x_003845 [Novipirellula sp. SH528]|uniref:hypothetical protein n=1 Tax=Novipirellula sp. SH528 TaxID=3454466 RepID=UPI003F9F3605